MEFRWEGPILKVEPVGLKSHVQISLPPGYGFYDNIKDPNDRGYEAIRQVFLNTIVENSALNPANAP